MKKWIAPVLTFLCCATAVNAQERLLLDTNMAKTYVLNIHKRSDGSWSVERKDVFKKPGLEDLKKAEELKDLNIAYRKSTVLYDCKARTATMTAMAFFGPKGKEVISFPGDGEVEKIEKGSLDEVIFKAVCSHKSQF